MGTTIINKNEPLDILESIDGLVWNNDNSTNFNLANNLYIMSNNEIITTLSNGFGFSFVKRSDIDGVFIDISLGDTSFLDPGKYIWKMTIKSNNDKDEIIKEISGEIVVLDSMARQIERQVKPWDLINDKRPKVSKQKRNERYSICKSCEKYNLGLCMECGCIMGLKTMLQEAKCPIHKW